jgi:hypothetical protein
VSRSESRSTCSLPLPPLLAPLITDTFTRISILTSVIDSSHQATIFFTNSFIRRRPIAIEDLISQQQLPPSPSHVRQRLSSSVRLPVNDGNPPFPFISAFQPPQTLYFLGNPAPRNASPLIIPITDPPFPSLLSLIVADEHVRRLLVPHASGLRTVGHVLAPRPRSSLPSANRGGGSILCANRDEYLARPTLPTHFHSFEALTTPAAPNDTVPAVQDDLKSKGKVLSGRDVRAEGTWLGISQSTGRVALL